MLEFANVSSDGSVKIDELSKACHYILIKHEVIVIAIFFSFMAKGANFIANYRHLIFIDQLASIALEMIMQIKICS